MSPLSNSVYSSVFPYNPNVLMRQYQHLTTKSLIELHHITCVTLDNSVFIVRFGGQALNQRQIGSCRSVITSKCEIITKENSCEEKRHMPHDKVILRSYTYWD